MTKPLSEKHRILVNEYFKCGGNKREAMRRAGYKTHPDSYSERLFKKEDVVAEVERRRKKVQDKYDLTEEWIITRLKRIADSPAILSKFIRVSPDGKLDWDFSTATQEELDVVKSFSVERDGETLKKFKIDPTDYVAALNSLAKIKGMFIEKKEISGPEGGPIEINDKELARRIAFLLASNEQKETE